jgi:hypothetical protein
MMNGRFFLIIKCLLHLTLLFKIACIVLSQQHDDITVDFITEENQKDDNSSQLRPMGTFLQTLKQGTHRKLQTRNTIGSIEITNGTTSNNIDPNCLNNDALLAIAPCTTWDDFFQGVTTFYSRVVIPCGQCVQIIPHSDAIINYNLVLLDGIDVQGKLILDCNNFKSTPLDASLQSNTSNTFMNGETTRTITLTTTLLVVQGQLNINATCKKVDGQPIVVIHMIPKDTIGSNSTFQPIHAITSNFCGSPCNAGEKSIMIAGGSVNGTLIKIIEI